MGSPRNLIAANKFSGGTHLQSRPQRSPIYKFSKKLNSHLEVTDTQEEEPAETTHTKRSAKISNIRIIKHKHNTIMFKEIKVAIDKMNIKK